MRDIYQKFDRAFANVDAYCVLKDGKPVARVRLKYPKDGAGRLTAFVQVYGFEMKRCTTDGITGEQFPRFTFRTFENGRYCCTFEQRKGDAPHNVERIRHTVNSWGAAGVDAIEMAFYTGDLTRAAGVVRHLFGLQHPAPDLFDQLPRVSAVMKAPVQESLR